jgi:uncharacterized protein YjeT (DUF2065 family)
MVDFATPLMVAAFGLLMFGMPQALLRTYATARRSVAGRRGGGAMMVDNPTQTMRLAGMLVMLFGLVLLLVQAP